MTEGTGKKSGATGVSASSEGGYIDIRALVQQTLDSALHSLGIYSFWQRRTSIDGQDFDEYVIYTLGAGNSETQADNKCLVKSKNVTIRYYYSEAMITTAGGRNRIKEMEQLIVDAMNAAGFYSPEGFFDAGNVDNTKNRAGIGFFTSVVELYYYEVL